MNNFELSEEEIKDIIIFIDHALDREWDSYTNNFITSTPAEEGKRSMDPSMYDLKEKLEAMIYA